jgi:D-alanyl-lipoteichoic acid acyltransferase DltB (MBOAT superfamily)
MMNVLFGDPTLWEAPPIHVEIQPTGWLLDGGVPMWLLYGGAIFMALRTSYRIAVRAASSSLQDVATLVLCMQVTIFGLCFTGPMFNTQLGILFWAVTGALYGAVLGLQEQSHDRSVLDRA